MMIMRLFGGALLLAATGLNARAVEVDFNHWSLDPLSSDYHFDSGPTLTSVAGANVMGLTFTSTVFDPGTPISGHSNSGCTGLCSNFYYSLAMSFRVNSPSVSLLALNHYQLKFNVDLANFSSTADYNVGSPSVVLYYLSSNSPVEGCSSCAIAAIPQTPGTFSVDFVPQFTGSTAFGLAFVMGTSVNGAASSSTTPFSESGSYLFSDFSVTDLSAPVAVPGPVVGAGLPGLLIATAGFIGWRRRRRAIAA